MKLFVYGTLKAGGSNHRLLQEAFAKFLHEDYIAGMLFDAGPWPIAIPGKNVIFGEVYEIPPNLISKLDRLEGHPNLFERREAQTEGWKDNVIVYMMNSLPNAGVMLKHHFVPSGMWREKVTTLVTNPKEKQA